MKILLLQRMIYVPTFGGANKANRLLMEGFVERGHCCRVIATAMGSHGPQTEESFGQTLRTRGLNTLRFNSEAVVFEQKGVQVHAVLSPAAIHRYAENEIKDFDPDWVLVTSEDPGQVLLESALNVAADRTIYIVHTPLQLPFGPGCFLPSATGTELLRKVRGIITVSKFVKGYIARWSGLDAEVLRFPVYGAGPFENLGAFEKGMVTLINPCAYKGISIFLELASRMPDIEFAGVPTWGTTAADRAALNGLLNITVLPATDDIREILAKTRVLLIPSLWMEALSLLPIEAMLHGIPVLASNVGGLPESKMGVDYILPVNPIEQYEARFDEREYPVPVVPSQNVDAWEDALREILGDRQRYEKLSAESRRAALEFTSGVGLQPFEDFLARKASIRNQAQENGSVAGKTEVEKLNGVVVTDSVAAKKQTLLELRAIRSHKTNGRTSKRDSQR
jgi:glycosyltransferase involved in cell wall biosynthesis